MTLCDIILKHGDGLGEEMMWKSIRIISDAVESDMDAAAREKLLRKVYGAMTEGHYSEEMAHEEIKKMYYIDSANQKHQAPYWPTEAVMEIYESRKDEIPDYNKWDFLVTMNMIASDNWCLLKKWFPNSNAADMTARITDMAIAWLKDEDWPTETKIWDYLSAR